MTEAIIPIPVYVLEPQPHRTGDYLKTLHDWGALPEIVTVPNVARLLALLCKQNPAAILKALEGAIETQQIKYWSWGATPHGGAWKEDAETILIQNGVGVLHLGSMGIRPIDAVALLVARGRKVPPELLGLLPTGQTTTTPSPEMKPPASPTPLVKEITPEQRQANRWQLCIDAGLKMPSDTYGHYPRGIGKVAKSLGIKRPSLREDLDRYRERTMGK